MHPDFRTRIAGVIQAIRAAVRLILRDFVRVVDFAVVDPAGVDVEGKTQHRAAHHRAFQVPARSAPAPRRIPFHLPSLARGGFAPDCEVGGVALALDRLDPALAIVGHSARQPPVIGHGRDIEIEPALQFVAVLVRNALGEFDHLRDVIGGDRPLRRLPDIQRLHIGPIGLLVMLGDVPDRLRLARRHFLHLVLARVGIIGEMADIGDVDDVGELQPLPRKRAPQHIGKDIGAHIADVGVVIDRRPAGVDARLAGVDGREHLGLPGERVEQLERRIGHARAFALIRYPGASRDRLRQPRPLRPATPACAGMTGFIRTR